MGEIATVTISAVNYPGRDLTVMMNADVPSVSGGIARWNKLNRPRRRDALEYDGEDPLTLNFGVMVDGFPDDDIEGICRGLYSWAAKNDFEQPTIVHVTGPVPYSDLDYVITKIDDSGEVQRRSDGLRCRQELKFEFTEYQAPDLITQTITPAAAVAQTAARANASSASSASTDKPGASGGGTYTVRRGETLSGIAAKKLGNANRWHEIADINGIRDPRRLQIGQVLRLP